MQLVGKFVGLGPQGVCGGPGGAKFALEGGELRAVTERGDGADVPAVRSDGSPVQHH